MRLRYAVALGGVVGAVSLGLAAPAMAANTAPGDVTVTPAKAHRGDGIHIVVPPCDTNGSIAYSTAFAQVSLHQGAPNGPPGVRGEATIKPQAGFGPHKIVVKCGGATSGVEYSGIVTVTPTASPTGGAKTGAGGVAGGANLPLMSTGAALVLGAGAAGSVAIRRRRSDART